MSSDLKIEIFAYNYFHNMWFRTDFVDSKPKPLEVYKDEITIDRDYLEACDSVFEDAIECHSMLFADIFLKKLDYGRAVMWKSLSECCDHLTYICDTDELFSHLSVFERMIATSAFVGFACYFSISEYGLLRDIVNYGHIIWAMYFDKFVETFYKEGGWRYLKTLANFYGSLIAIFRIHQFTNLGSYLIGISREATSNYIKFKTVCINENYRYKDRGKSDISKLWIKFHIENFEEYIIFPFSIHDSVNVYDTKYLLQDLRKIYDISIDYDTSNFKILKGKLQKCMCSTGIAYSKSLNRGEEIVSKVEHGIKNLTMSEAFRNENPYGRKYFEAEIQDEFPTSCEKLQSHKNTDMDGNFRNEIRKTKIKCEDILDEYSLTRCSNLSACIMSQQLQTCRNFCQKHSDLESNYNLPSFDIEIKDNLCDTTSCIIAKDHNTVKNASDVLPKNWENEPEWDAKISPNKQSVGMDFGSKNEVAKCQIEKEISESEIDSNVYETKMREYNKYTETACTSSNQISPRMSFPKDDLYQNKDAKDYDGRTNTNLGMNILRTEQKDPVIKIFLRMIMVLDDREGIQYILEPLGCFEESPVNSQEKPNKKNLKS